MGKSYDRRYHLAPAGVRCGTMVCGRCQQPIDEKTQDFMEAKKNRDGDWGYVTHHRACLPTEAHGPFLKLEQERENAKARLRNLRAAAIAFRDEWKIDDLDQLIDDLGD